MAETLCVNQVCAMGILMRLRRRTHVQLGGRRLGDGGLGFTPSPRRIGPRYSLCLRLCAASAFAAAMTSPALAQTPGRVAGEDSGYLQWIVFLGIGVIVCLTGFVNPKRSHLN